MPGEKMDDNLNFKRIEARPRFPEKVEYVISPKEALEVIHNTLEKIKNFREDRLYILKTLIGPLVPESIRSKIEKSSFDQLSIAYSSLINGIGNIVSALVLFNMEEYVQSVKENYRFIVLPYLELKFYKKIEHLEKEKPFGWKIARKFYQRNLNDLSPLVDNLINLVTLAWTFCPAIGEPEKETGYFNRFVFTCNGGFIDLGHFFNCSIVAYLYGTEQAKQRAEATEKDQRKFREKQWLLKLRERNYLRLITNLLWGYATSADTIEDRGSNKLGIDLGKHIRDYDDNEKLIDYYIEFYIKNVRKSIKLLRKLSTFHRIIDTIKMLFKNMFYTSYNTKRIDIEKYMKEFFDKYDAINPNDYSVAPPGLFKNIVDFYTEKYASENWDKYTCTDWHAVIPQDLWDQVVKGREKYQQKDISIKIQLKETGELVDPY